MLSEPRGNYSEEGQIGKDRFRLKKNERSNNKKKSPNAKFGRTDIENITKKYLKKEGEIWLTKLDFDYGYGQIKLDDETKNLCIFTITGGEVTGYYRFLKGFYGLADIPTIFQERIDKTLEFKHPAWLDDIIIVTKGTIDNHEAEVKETMEKLKKPGTDYTQTNANSSNRKQNGLDIEWTKTESDLYKINWEPSQR